MTTYVKDIETWVETEVYSGVATLVRKIDPVRSGDSSIHAVVAARFATFTAKGGWYCGYAQCPTQFDAEDFDVHGGITFDGPMDDTGIRWIGFDCAHGEDLENPKDLDYVREQVKSLAKQIDDKKKEWAQRNLLHADNNTSQT